jgi:hypothetical protein
MTSAKPGIANIVLPFSITNTQQTTLQIADIEAGFILASYGSPNGNNPTSFSNNLFVWVSQGVGTGVPWGQAPFASASATPGSGAINAPSGSNYAANPYCVGYSVGPSVTTSGVTTYPNVCATAEIGGDWNLNNVQTFSASLGITAVQTAFISFTYTLPQGVNPSANGAWIGFWNGTVTTYNNMPNKAAPITQTTNAGQAAMTGLGLQPRGQYTAALFTSGYSTTPANLNLTTVATVIQFTTSASLLDPR